MTIKIFLQSYRRMLSYKSKAIRNYKWQFWQVATHFMVVWAYCNFFCFISCFVCQIYVPFIFWKSLQDSGGVKFCFLPHTPKGHSSLPMPGSLVVASLLSDVHWESNNNNNKTLAVEYCHHSPVMSAQHSGDWGRRNTSPKSASTNSRQTWAA